MRRYHRILSIGIVVAALAACTNESTTVPSAPQANVYLQVDREGRPGIKELFEPFTDHSSSDRAIPTNDSVLTNDLQSFATSTTQPAPGQSSAMLVSKLSPDYLQLNLAGTTASYLALETGNSGSFGGRALSDDAMSADLNAAYGTLFGGTTVPCLTTDNVSAMASAAASAGAKSQAFPYLAGPQ